MFINNINKYYRGVVVTSGVFSGEDSCQHNPLKSPILALIVTVVTVVPTMLLIVTMFQVVPIVTVVPSCYRYERSN